MRPTVSDIAQQAGVSTATVDRVLNRRPGVSGRTREIVLETAERLGYLGKESSREARVLNLDFVLPAGSNSFMAELKQQLAYWAVARGGELNARLHSIDGFDPASFVETLRGLERQSDGVALVGLDHPAVREAIRSFVATGAPLITLLSDIHHVPRAGYVGIDNRGAGRLAGLLLGRLLPSGPHRVAMIAGSLSYRGHEEREIGFRHILLEQFPDLEIVGLTEAHDDTERAYLAARRHLEEHPEIAAIYNIGAGNRGVARAIEEHGLGGSLLFIGHDLTQHTRKFLLSGTMDVVIDQNARVEAREAVEQLARAARGEPWTMHPLRIAALFKENIPDD